jgi:hypothetical protein
MTIAADHAGPPPTLDEIRRWPATVELWPRAAQAYGLTRWHAYALYRRDELPFRVLRLGKRLRVVTAEIVASLSVQDP